MRPGNEGAAVFKDGRAADDERSGSASVDVELDRFGRSVLEGAAVWDAESFELSVELCAVLCGVLLLPVLLALCVGVAFESVVC